MNKSESDWIANYLAKEHGQLKSVRRDPAPEIPFEEDHIRFEIEWFVWGLVMGAAVAIIFLA
jgi:hypothetical protein